MTHVHFHYLTLCSCFFPSFFLLSFFSIFVELGGRRPRDYVDEERLEALRLATRSQKQIQKRVELRERIERGKESILEELVGKQAAALVLNKPKPKTREQEAAEFERRIQQRRALAASLLEDDVLDERGNVVAPHKRNDIDAQDAIAKRIKQLKMQRRGGKGATDPDAEGKNAVEVYESKIAEFNAAKEQARVAAERREQQRSLRKGGEEYDDDDDVDGPDDDGALGEEDDDLYRDPRTYTADDFDDYYEERARMMKKKLKNAAPIAGHVDNVDADAVSRRRGGKINLAEDDFDSAEDDKTVVIDDDDVDREDDEDQHPADKDRFLDHNKKKGYNVVFEEPPSDYEPPMQTTERRKELEELRAYYADGMSTSFEQHASVHTRKAMAAKELKMRQARRRMEKLDKAEAAAAATGAAPGGAAADVGDMSGILGTPVVKAATSSSSTSSKKPQSTSSSSSSSSMVRASGRGASSVGTPVDFEPIVPPSIDDAWTSKRLPPSRSAQVQDAMTAFYRGDTITMTRDADVEELKKARELGLKNLQMMSRTELPTRGTGSKAGKVSALDLLGTDMTPEDYAEVR